MDANVANNKFKKTEMKHQLEGEIKLMHLKSNALLKNEMDDKLEQLNHLGESLSQPKMVIENKLGLLSQQDLQKKTLKERLHEPKAETNAKN